jgi:hypothetical protein
MKTLQDFIDYYGETFGPIKYNEANPIFEFAIECGDY